jgi:MFS superfamily sulfate permease-like transporter
LLFRLFPHAVLGVILFLAGVQLAVGGKDAGPHDKADRFVVLTTAAFAIWNVGVAVLFGMLVHHGVKRGWMRL